jgi:hypothetical protein
MKPTKIRWAKTFTNQYKKKSKANRTAIDRALKMMGDDVYHPSLRTKKMRGFGEIREAHATRGQTMSLTIEGAEVFMRVCCNHDDVYRRP